jgi:hypothetical protein
MIEVFPAPRKPVKTVMGIDGAIVAATVIGYGICKTCSADQAMCVVAICQCRDFIYVMSDA